MFKSARVKLTAWYLLIIMSVTVSLSVVVYTGVMQTTERALIVHEKRLEARMLAFTRFQGSYAVPTAYIEQTTLLEVRNKTILILVLLNSIILAVAGSVGYILAGITLAPIEDMINKQKTFIADAAHELKTPLTAMKTSMEVHLRDKKFSVEDARTVLTDAIEDIDTLTKLTNSLLTESKYQALDKKLTLETFDINEVIRGVIKKHEHKFSEKQLNISFEPTKDKIGISADKLAITELITILIDNATKFNKQSGSINVVCNNSSSKVSIIIEDTGIGISKNSIPRIFDRFYKVEAARSRHKHDGFGIGLAIAKEIVDKHSGQITVESIENIGSKFTVTLPSKS